VDQRNEESMAGVLWTFLERVREDGNPRFAGMDRLTAEDAEELAEMFHTAVMLRETIGSDDTAPSPAVEARVMAAIEERRPVSTSLLNRPLRLPPPGRRAGWAAVTAVLVLVGVVAANILIPRDPLTNPPAHTRALDHYEAHMLASQLNGPAMKEPDARAAMWHLAHCTECMAAFQAHARMAAESAKPAAVKVSNRAAGAPPAPAVPQSCGAACPLASCGAPPAAPGNNPHGSSLPPQ
jgi:hypothetical protein